MSTTTRFRVLSFISRKASLKPEEFDRLWLAHAQLINTKIPAVASGKVKYKQLHLHRDANEVFTSKGSTVIDCDGIAEWETDSYEELQAITGCDEYSKYVAPDEENFLDRDKTIPTIAYRSD